MFAIYRAIAEAAKPVLATGGRAEPRQSAQDLLDTLLSSSFKDLVLPVNSLPDSELATENVKNAVLLASQVPGVCQIEIQLHYRRQLSQSLVVWMSESGLIDFYREVKRWRKPPSKLCLRPLKIDSVIDFIGIYSSS